MLIAAVLAGYGLGCLCSGYYLVRLVRGADVRRHGTGVTGATNVGRLLGPVGFVVTFVLDAAKGGAAVWGAWRLGPDPWSTTLVLLAVVSGHIWPVQLRFRGGKGVATALGGLAAYDSRAVLVIGGLFLVFLLACRAFVVSGLAAFLLAPLPLLPLGAPAVHALGVATVAVLILIAHRDHLRTVRRGGC